MLRNSDRIRMMHMLDAARDAVELTSGREFADLQSDKQLRFSVVHCIEILGEAASRVSTECVVAYPEIPWGRIVGMRNRLIHGYYDINLTIVWRTVTEELPGVIVELER
ncbi:MAG: DUF86 domain-containing protein, partial [Armatimonadetes bacterium]|nr:DUF86 domain-containing protein [Armatimonadota bacterium]